MKTLTPSKALSCIALAGLFAVSLMGMQTASAQTPTVQTQAATSVASTSAVLNAVISSDGGAAVDQRRFDFGTNSGALSQFTSAVTVSGNTFSYTWNGLSPGTTYYFRAWAHNSAGWAPTAGILSFTTLAAPAQAPTVQTQAATSVTSASAVLNAVISSDGGAAVDQRRFDFGTNSGALSQVTSAVTVSGNTFNYTWNGLSPSTTYYFRAWAHNSAGWAPTAGVLSFTTLSAPGQAPMITAQPASATVTAGQTATFSVTANGTAPLSFQWQKNNSNIAGATASVYTTPATVTSDSGSTFRCVVSNGYGSVASNPASLTVNSAGTAPTITTQPVNMTVTAGQTATFSMSAAGTAPLNFQWQKNNSNIAGATASVYTTPATVTSDSGSTFRCVVSNGYGSVASNPASLTVNSAGTAPTITTQPVNMTVTAGQTATFSMSAAGTAPLNFQWQKNNSNIAGATASVYTTPATVTSDSGSTFRCVVSNGYGSAASNPATLTVNSAGTAPTITTQPVNMTVTAGQTATFSMSAAGTAPLNFQWQKNNSNIAGATASVYTTPATVTSDSGSTFRCVVSNGYGSAASNPATLTVNSARGGVTTLSNSVPVANLSGALGAQQIFKINVPAGQTSLTITISGGTGDCDLYVKFGAQPGLTVYDYRPYVGGNNESVPVTNPAAGDWFIMLNGYNAYSSVTLVASFQGVTGTAPTIASQPPSATVTVGQTATFSVTANGTAPLSFQWQKNNSNIASATASVYTTPATVTSDSGSTFRCVVSNGYGSVASNPASLTVNSAGTAPTITTQPVNMTVTAGQTATFSMSAAGTAPLSFQWQKNNSNVAGATASVYTTPGTVTSDSGSTFRCVVSNGYGSVASNPATLTVNPAGGGVTTLSNNVSVANLSGAQGAQQHFKISVPAGQTSLTITISGGTGDCDLYIKLGTQPSLTVYDYRPYVGGNNESVPVTNPTAGDWFIMLNGYNAYAGVTLVASFQGATGTAVKLSGVPYIHQLYDTADDFTGGNDCCNATSALMAIQYYNKLPGNSITCTRGGSHTSTYGFYVSKIYMYNGHTFNTASSNVWGSSLAGYYGGFGYFLQDAAGDSLQHSMRLSEYIAYHGLISSVDQVVSGETGFTKIRAEIDAGHPVVVLNSLTTAGHYITCIGYVQGQHTLIFNDPYGNKQTGYPNKNGAEVRYDWPGYNNGYQNLNTVHRIVYAKPQSAAPLAARAVESAETLAPVLQSQPTVTPPSPVNIGQTVTFNAAATDPKGSALNYSWDFGDGSYGFGASCVHTYATAGTYAAKVTVTNGALATQGTVNVVVASNFSELKISLKFNFSKLRADSLLMTGSVPLPEGFTPAGASIGVTIGGVKRDFKLDSHCRSKGSGTFALAGKLKNGALASPGMKFSLELSKQAMFADLKDHGFSEEDAIAVQVTVPVTIQIGDCGFHADVPVTYSAKKGKSATAKK